MQSPNVIFCNLQNSGSSAIDPILRDLLRAKGTFVTPYGPEGTSGLRKYVAKGLVGKPFYHWTHDPVKTFRGMIGNPSFRFIYLHRDPRDAAVSWAHDLLQNGACEGMTFREILSMVVTHAQPPHVKAAIEWIKSDCFVITFRQVREDPRGVIRSILDYVDYFDERTGKPLAELQIEEVIDKYSFEKLTGRNRGEEGKMIRTGYMLRKGISGEWKQHFDDELVQKCNKAIGREIVELGYEPFVFDENSAARDNVDLKDSYNEYSHCLAAWRSRSRRLVIDRVFPQLNRVKEKLVARRQKKIS